MPASVFDGPLGPTLFKVVSGTPSAEELAAVTAVLTALAVTAGAETEAGQLPASDIADWNRPELLPPASWMAARRSAGS
ncbi:acyl-CoA carboxylase subunit epsilon [Streptomyces sp. NPDC048751]|uniref:acyl-CoA carboxylase subunit epsilon n=1 Tax=Streptomyces sp. NPDC048751 TaxID=3365591 RepID=UPI00371DEBD2